MKKEEEENSINSETLANEEKSVTKKIRNFSSVNMMTSCNFTRQEKNNYEKESSLNGQIKSHTNSRSINSQQDSIRSYVIASTGDNSHVQSSNGRHNRMSNLFIIEDSGDATSYYSPQRKRESELKLGNKLANSYVKHTNKLLNDRYGQDEESLYQEDYKKVTILLSLKDKEMEDMINKYKSLKEQYTINKTNLEKEKERFRNLKSSNLNMKKIICKMIKNKHETIN